MPRVLTTTLCAAMLIALTTASEGLADDAATLAKGKEAYTTFCVTCHGETGDGKGMLAGSLNPAPRDFTVGDFKYGGSDQDIFDVISNGAASKGGSPLMAAWSKVITAEEDRWAVVKYIRSLKKPKK